jgi:hypothetical protein
MRRLLFLLILLPIIRPATGQEVRGVWLTDVDSDVLASRENIEAGMRFLAENGFNVVYPVVWNGGYTLYPSPTLASVIGVDRDPAIGQRDVLQEVLVEAHRFGLEVIPWMEYGFASSFGQDGGALLAARPEWAARTFIGDKVQRNGFYWMSGLNPEVQQFILDLMTEILAYDVDGIQGDDRLPAMPVTGGYSAAAVAQYRTDHGGADPPPDERNPDWIQWRADQLTAFAARIRDHVKAVDPNLKVVFSPSVWPWSRDNYMQDWPAWIAAGIPDIVHPQLYPPPPRSVDAYHALVHDMVGTSPGDFLGYIPPDQRSTLFPGLLIKAGTDLVGADRVLPMMAEHRALGLPGESFFFYEGLGEQNNLLAHDLRDAWYGQPAQLPGREGIWRPASTSLLPDPHSGSWRTLGPVGPDNAEVFAAVHGSQSAATYRGSVPAEGTYTVWMFVPDTVIQPSDAAMLAPGTELPVITTVDQRIGGSSSRWVEAGTFHFHSGPVTIHLSTPETTDGREVVAGPMLLLLNRRLSPDTFVDPVSVTVERPDQLHHSARFALYPNPASTFIQVDGASVDIFDLLGRPMLRSASGRIDTSRWPAGLYVARADGQSRLFVVR